MLEICRTTEEEDTEDEDTEDEKIEELLEYDVAAGELYDFTGPEDIELRGESVIVAEVSLALDICAAVL